MGDHNYGFIDNKTVDRVWNDNLPLKIQLEITNDNTFILFEDVSSESAKWIWDCINDIQDKMATIDTFSEKDYNYLIPVFKKHNIPKEKYKELRKLLGKRIKFDCLD